MYILGCLYTDCHTMLFCLDARSQALRPRFTCKGSCQSSMCSLCHHLIRSISYSTFPILCPILHFPPSGWVEGWMGRRCSHLALQGGWDSTHEIVKQENNQRATVLSFIPLWEGYSNHLHRHSQRGTFRWTQDRSSTWFPDLGKCLLERDGHQFQRQPSLALQASWGYPCGRQGPRWNGNANCVKLFFLSYPANEIFIEPGRGEDENCLLGHTRKNLSPVLIGDVTRTPRTGTKMGYCDAYKQGTRPWLWWSELLEHFFIRGPK